MPFTEKLLQFAINHWVLVAGFFVLLVCLFIDETRTKGRGRLTVQQTVDLINHEQVLILDIRDKALFRQGHIAQARNIPQQSIEQKTNSISAFRHRPIVVVCQQGQVSARAAARLRKLGFDKVQILEGGMRAWQNALMPIKRKLEKEK